MNLTEIFKENIVVCFCIAIIVAMIVLGIVLDRKQKKNIQKFELMPNTFELQPYGVDLNNDVLNINEQENNVQGYNVYDNAVIKFNNKLNSYASFKNDVPEPEISVSKTCDMDKVKINHMNEVDVINSFIQSQLTDTQNIKDIEDSEITNLRNNNAGKYSDVNTIINQNSMEYISAPDVINAIRTSDGKEKFSSLGETLWEAYDNLVKPGF